ncbi:hypothetical protein AAMO2058_001390200 [Amorphochlora amoebiformis]
MPRGRGRRRRNPFSKMRWMLSSGKKPFIFIVAVCAVVAISQLDFRLPEVKPKLCDNRSKDVLPFVGSSNPTAQFLTENNWNISSVPWSPTKIGSFFGSEACPFTQDGNPVDLRSLTDLVKSSLRYSCYTVPYVPKHLGERHLGGDILYEKISIKKVVRVGLLPMYKPLLHVDSSRVLPKPAPEVREQGCMRRGFIVMFPQGSINYNHWFTHHATGLAQWYRLQSMEPQCPIQIVLSTPFRQPELKSKMFHWFMSDFPSYVYQTLEAIGCEERNIVRMPGNSSKIEVFDELYYSSHTSSTLNSQSSVAYEFYDLVRRGVGLVKPCLVYGDSTLKTSGAIIVRKLKGKDKKKHGAVMCPRKAVGMDNIIDWLVTEHHFEALELSSYKTLKDKVDILRNRSMVVIEAGSSCVNMLFMSANTRVAILAGPYFETDWYSDWLAAPYNIVGTQIRAGACGNRTTSKEDWVTCAVSCPIEPLTHGRCCPWNVHLDYTKSAILGIMHESRTGTILP